MWSASGDYTITATAGPDSGQSIFSFTGSGGSGDPVSGDTGSTGSGPGSAGASGFGEFLCQYHMIVGGDLKWIEGAGREIYCFTSNLHLLGSNRMRIIRNIEKRVVEEFLE